MLDIGSSRADGWRPPIVETVATAGDGTAELFDAIDALRAHLESGAGQVRRHEQAATLLRRIYAARMARAVEGLAATPTFERLVDDVASGTIPTPTRRSTSCSCS